MLLNNTGNDTYALCSALFGNVMTFGWTKLTGMNVTSWCRYNIKLNCQDIMLCFCWFISY